MDLGTTIPAVNTTETEKDYKLEIAAPGLKKEDFKTKVIFETGLELDLDISHRSLNNQILRATMLESVLRKRKANIKLI